MCEQGRKNIKYALARKIINPISRRFGFTIITDHYYQPIPNKNELLIYVNKPRPLESIVWNLNNQVEFTNKILIKYKKEFNDPNIISSFGYNEKLAAFGSGDSEFLYGMVRELKPNLIIEIGAGASTQIILAALKKNHNELNIISTFLSIDPFPGQFVESIDKEFLYFVDFRIIKEKVQEVNPSIFNKLMENDILFVDSSHVFKQGSDVELEFLRIYPNINKGVYVHIHDIFFPNDYPHEWNERENRFWNEQYHLETFLLLNDKYQVVTSLSMVSETHQSIFMDNINHYHVARVPGSLWMKAVK
jgi:hypothetical protein